MPATQARGVATVPCTGPSAAVDDRSAAVRRRIPDGGIGVISTLTSPITASLAFLAMIIVFALAALASGIKGRPA